MSILHGDCLEIMKGMESNSIDFIVTDPPYGLNFMGKDWDKKIPGIDIWAEVLRVCKPGSLLAAFGGTRTHHHLMLALEKAGWEIRDCIMWLHGQGFPKSHNKFGIEGYGTALKPAYEPIILAMKPLDGTYKHNVEKWGIGGINIDECRISVDNFDPNHRVSSKGNEGLNSMFGMGGHIGNLKNQGRWPSNLILDEEAGQMLDDQTGISKSISTARNNKPNENQCMSGANTGHISFGHNDSGGASRFFYCAKASTRERNEGLEKKECNELHGKNYISNFHPTVKPISLMTYIIKLLAPPNNPILLDPFCGSGSTLIAAKKLGIRSIGIEISLEYCEIAEKRVENF